MGLDVSLDTTLMASSLQIGTGWSVPDTFCTTSLTSCSAERHNFSGVYR